MHRSTNLAEICLQQYKQKEENKKNFQRMRQNVEKIKRIAFEKIKYPDSKEAFEYVDKLFPRVKIKEIIIYKVSYKDLVKMGLVGIEGFYDSISKIIVVSGSHKSVIPVNREFHIEAKVSKDEVMVHELCHYCYVFEGQRSESIELREEFAYGWSLGYLRKKEHSDEYIVKYNFLPYLMNISFEEATKNILAQNKITHREYNSHNKFERKDFNRKFERKIFRRAKEIAIERGYRIIDIYNRKLKEGTGFLDEEPEGDRFDFLDIR